MGPCVGPSIGGVGAMARMVGAVSRAGGFGAHICLLGCGTQTRGFATPPRGRAVAPVVLAGARLVGMKAWSAKQ